MRALKSAGAIAATTAGMNSSSARPRTTGGSVPTETNAMRPRSHRTTSRISGAPANPRLPVQLGTAVSKKPATAAPINPYSISWPCQRCGGSGPIGEDPVSYIQSQANIPAAA